MPDGWAVCVNVNCCQTYVQRPSSCHRRLRKSKEAAHNSGLHLQPYSPSGRVLCSRASHWHYCHPSIRDRYYRYYRCCPHAIQSLVFATSSSPNTPRSGGIPLSKPSSSVEPPSHAHLSLSPCPRLFLRPSAFLTPRHSTRLLLRRSVQLGIQTSFTRLGANELIDINDAHLLHSGHTGGTLDTHLLHKMNLPWPDKGV